MSISIEPANLDSLNELWRIERECFTKEAYTKQQIASLLKGQGAVGLVARVNGEIVGFVIGVVEDFGSRLVSHIYTIDVAVKHRRKGVGMRLLNDIEAVFAKRSVNAVYLEVRESNEAAQRLYEAQGYREVGAMENYYSKGIHGLRMMKYLKSRQNVSP